VRTSIGAVVEGGSSVNYRTGNWREFRPVFMAGIAPCREACPAGIDIARFLREARYRRFDQAWHIIMEENPFPGICGRVCGHPCEETCNRKEFDEALAINALERFVGDYAIEKKLMISSPKAKRRETVAIVGSGPAGLSCAYHLRKLGFGVKVFERSPLAGGMLRWGIPDYRLPGKVLDGEIERLSGMGIEIETRVSPGKDFLTDGLKEFEAIFLALGAQKNLGLGIPGENCSGVITGLHFLREVKEGHPPHVGKRITVIGGGNTAIDVARTALRLGSNPTLIYRRTRRELPALSGEVEEALKEGVNIEFLASPVAITALGNDGVRVECVRNRMGEPGPDGRGTPFPIEGSNFCIASDTIVVAIGEVGDPDDLPQSLQWTKEGVTANEWGSTGVPGVFAGGDLTPGPRTVSHAIGSGKKAALAIDAFVNGWNIDRAQSVFLGNRGSISIDQWITPPPDAHRSNRVVPYEDLNRFYFEPRPRERMRQIYNVSTRIESFDEVNLGFSKKMALQEAERCFGCGTCSFCENCYTFCPDSSVWRKDQHETFEIDYEFCKGCGICAHECPSHCIEMVREEK
jgi:2-oxoacid:acceptor oxidoreductase delta subunit (pyruvate/2-ketoisovalerate family)